MDQSRATDWPQPTHTVHHFPATVESAHFSAPLGLSMGPATSSQTSLKSTERVLVEAMPFAFASFGQRQGANVEGNIDSLAAGDTAAVGACVRKSLPMLAITAKVQEDACAATSKRSLRERRSRTLLLKRTRSESDSGTEAETVLSPVKRLKRPSIFVKGKEMQAFFGLLYDPVVHDFLITDACRKISDKYLLAMTFVYFKRASLSLREYTRLNFFVALYLASDMEEDEEDYKYEIFPWALGKRWKSRYMSFLSKRDRFWKKIDHRAVVSKKCCEEVMAIEAEHWAWKRDRPEHHAGALRSYVRETEDALPRGPDRSPRHCDLCSSMAQYDSASPGGLSWYLSDGSDSESDTKFIKTVRVSTNGSRFDMNDLRKTLHSDDAIWATKEE